MSDLDKREDYLTRIERIRSSIPAEALLRLAYMASAQGMLPVCDDQGQPTGEYETVSAKDRLAVIGKLLDKAIPATPVKREELPPPPATLLDEMALLSNEELRRLAYQDHGENHE